MNSQRAAERRQYLVMLEGRRCVLTNHESGNRKSIGFFATRLVYADDATSAGSLAIERVIDEFSSNGILGNSPSKQPIIEISEVRSIDELDPEWAVNGFTFYEDKDLQ